MKYILDGVVYDVIIEKKNNKNLYIRVKEDGIHVSCNYFFSKNAIKNILDDNVISLRRMVSHVNREIEKSHAFYYLGKSYDIIIDEGINRTYIDGNTIYTKSVKSLERWLNKETIRIFDERYVYVFNNFKENVKSPILKIRKMKTRWGVYNKMNHSITLNSKLIEFDISKIDYVIIHELSHIKHFDHSHAFWSLVEKYCPNYKSIRKEMKE